MEAIIIDKPTVLLDRGFSSVSSNITIGSKTFNISYGSRDFVFDAKKSYADVFLAALLIPAMVVGRDIEVRGTISSTLLDGLESLQDIYLNWHAGFTRTKINPQNITGNKGLTKRKSVASFFTGGVDSSYTLLRHEQEIDALVYVHGFDVPLYDKETRSRTTKDLHEMAAKFKKRLIEVETNLKEFSDQYADWGLHYHGAALSSVALLLANQISKFYFPSTHTYADLFPWGSHVLTDRLWSNGHAEFVHDGAEAGRFEKILQISKNKYVLNHLTVCWERIEKPQNERNCSRCKKCLRTMACLETIGMLGKCKVFAKDLDIHAVSNMQLSSSNDYAQTVDIYYNLKGYSGHNKLKLALKIAIQRYDYQLLAETLDKNLPGFLQSAVFNTVRPKLIKYLWQSSTKEIIKTAPQEIAKKLGAKISKKNLAGIYERYDKKKNH
jgi:hypothetical protein